MSWDLIFQHLFIVLAASLLSIAVGLSTIQVVGV